MNRTEGDFKHGISNLIAVDKFNPLTIDLDDVLSDISDINYLTAEEDISPSPTLVQRDGVFDWTDKINKVPKKNKRRHSQNIRC